MNDSSPNWDLLPHNATGFFELESGFDRKQLRRSYGRLIRQFKPETHPQEFQRIREAYEGLEGQLRYGQETQNQDQQASQAAWAMFVSSAIPTPADEVRHVETAPSKPAPTPLWERMESESPKSVYVELSKQEKRSAYDYYALAILSDVVQPKEPLMFLRWLLTGLNEHRHEPGLMRLLQEYFRSDLPDKAVVQALTLTAKAVRSDRYFFLTEPLWDRLLKNEPFDRFSQTLAKCESTLRDHEVAGRLAFNIHLLRRAVWKADEAWLDERLQWVEGHGVEIDPMLENDLEIASLLRTYRKSSAKFLDGSRVRASIDKVIRAFAEDDPIDAASKIVQLQDEIARDAQGVMAAFPIEGDETTASAVLTYRVVVAEVAELVGMDAKQSSPRELEKQSYRMLRDMREELGPVIGRCVWAGRRIHWGTGGLLVLGPIFLFYGVFEYAFWQLAFLWAAVSLVVYIFVIKKFWTDALFERQIRKIFRKVYIQNWRPRLFRFFQAVSAPFHESIERIIVSSQEVGDDFWIGWLFEFASEDQGVEVYATAQPFLR